MECIVLLSSLYIAPTLSPYCWITVWTQLLCNKIVCHETFVVYYPSRYVRTKSQLRLDYRVSSKLSPPFIFFRGHLNACLRRVFTASGLETIAKVHYRKKNFKTPFSTKKSWAKRGVFCEFTFFFNFIPYIFTI